MRAPGPAGAWTDCVVHVLAHAPVPGAASLYDPRYVAWVRERLEPAAWAPAAEDAGTVAALAARVPAWWRVQALGELHEDLEGFRASAGRRLARLDPGEVRDPRLLATLRAVDEALVEIVRADLALVARAYARAHGETLAREVSEAGVAGASWWARAWEAMPALGDFRVVLSHGLGARGRAFAERIVVGAAAEWNGLGPEHAVLQAMHEGMVVLAEREAGAAGPVEAGAVPWAPGGWRYVWSEWRALRALAELVRGTRLADAHRRWRARLDTRELDAAAARGGIDGAVEALVARARVARGATR